jgi:dienelactone hydrolase
MGLHHSRLSLCLVVLGSSLLQGQDTPQTPPKPSLKNELRLPWQRSEDRYLRNWLIAGAFAGSLDQDPLAGQGGEANLHPVAGQKSKRPDGSQAEWTPSVVWSDALSFESLEASLPKSGEPAVAYGYTTLTRAQAGKALLSIGSDEGLRVWVNGRLVLSRDGLRALTPDEDQVEVELKAGSNDLLVKVIQSVGPWTVSARVLEPGTVLTRRVEIGPSILRYAPSGFTLKTDIGAERPQATPVSVQVIGPGGKVFFEKSARRGARLEIDAKAWPNGPYEVRCSTRRADGRLFAEHLPWFKGDALAAARRVVAEAAKGDAAKPEGFTIRMLAEMVEDRLGSKVDEAVGNPWWKVHAPILEFEELMLERRGQKGRIRPHGFVRLAYRDEVDDSAQFCRAYLPAGYDGARKWPLVLQLHGYNGPNPKYVRWWGADSRHPGIDTEYKKDQGVIYLEPHGRGNTSYRGIGDQDVMRTIAEAKRLFNVDENRIYLTGDSMGGWGTWNVATRHPDVFAAIAPVFGGSDYHAEMTEEDLAKLSVWERFLQERRSSWAMAEGLNNTPIFVHHGDADQAVNVEYSRWGVRLLQRWGYDVRYREYPGKIHEALGWTNPDQSIAWFLEHRRNPDPARVRIRSAELRHASSYWVRVEQALSPAEFMVVDAERVDPNLIRLDTQNVAEIVLSPGKALVDPSRPLKVVWNGVAQETRLAGGSLKLTAPGHAPAVLRKSAQLPGSLDDFMSTPFAVVVGTIAQDPDLVELCRDKAQAFVGYWQEWQKHKPQVFKDTEISETDLAQYSLLLVGGPEANAVSAKLMDRLPIRITEDQISLDGHAFKAKDAAVQVLYPSPLNPQRYVLLSASTSTDGMYFCSVGQGGPVDFTITDGTVQAPRQDVFPSQLQVASGFFDPNWRFQEALCTAGDAQARAQARRITRPKAMKNVDVKSLEACVGRYQIENGPTLELFLDGQRLMARAGGGVLELIPESATEFFVKEINVRLKQIKDPAGKITGFEGTESNRPFMAKRLE